MIYESLNFSSIIDSAVKGLQRIKANKFSLSENLIEYDITPDAIELMTNNIKLIFYESISKIFINNLGNFDLPTKKDGFTSLREMMDDNLNNWDNHFDYNALSSISEELNSFFDDETTILRKTFGIMYYFKVLDLVQNIGGNMLNAALEFNFVVNRGDKEIYDVLTDCPSDNFVKKPFNDFEKRIKEIKEYYFSNYDRIQELIKKSYDIVFSRTKLRGEIAVFPAMVMFSAFKLEYCEDLVRSVRLGLANNNDRTKTLLIDAGDKIIQNVIFD